MQWLTSLYCCSSFGLQSKTRDKVLHTSYHHHPSCWWNLTSSIHLYNTRWLCSSKISSSYPPFYYCVHYALLTRHSLQGSGKGTVYLGSGNYPSSNGTSLILGRSFCIATSSEGLLYSCCISHSALSKWLHHGSCHMCDTCHGEDPSILLVLLSGHSRWPQVQQQW